MLRYEHDVVVNILLVTFASETFINMNIMVKYYFGLRLNENEEPTNNYLFFEEFKEGINTFLAPIDDENMKGLLLTAFTVNFLDKVYDEVLED